MIGIVVGFGAEGRIARRLNGSVAVGGGTAAGAERAAASLIAEGATALVSFGVAGGLDPALRPGDVIVPTHVITGSDMFATDERLARILGGMTRHWILGAAELAVTPARKCALFKATQASAVDLESGAVAQTASRHAVPFAVLRAIADPAERALPPAAIVALDSEGGVRIVRVLTSLLRHPGQMPVLLALARDTRTALRALAARFASR